MTTIALRPAWKCNGFSIFLCSKLCENENKTCDICFKNLAFVFEIFNAVKKSKVEANRLTKVVKQSPRQKVNFKMRVTEIFGFVKFFTSFEHFVHLSNNPPSDLFPELTGFVLHNIYLKHSSWVDLTLCVEIMHFGFVFECPVEKLEIPLNPCLSDLFECPCPTKHCNNKFNGVSLVFSRLSKKRKNVGHELANLKNIVHHSKTITLTQEDRDDRAQLNIRTRKTESFRILLATGLCDDSVVFSDVENESAEEELKVIRILDEITNSNNNSNSFVDNDTIDTNNNYIDDIYDNTNDNNEGYDIISSDISNTVSELDNIICESTSILPSQQENIQKNMISFLPHNDAVSKTKRSIPIFISNDNVSPRAPENPEQMLTFPLLTKYYILSQYFLEVFELFYV
jgi:hypothetical protein